MESKRNDAIWQREAETEICTNLSQRRAIGPPYSSMPLPIPDPEYLQSPSPAMGLNGLLIRSNHLSDGFIEFSFQQRYHSRYARGKHSLKILWEEDWILEKGVWGWWGDAEGIFYSVRFAQRPINTFSSQHPQGSAF